MLYTSLNAEHASTREPYVNGSYEPLSSSGYTLRLTVISADSAVAFKVGTGLNS